jgi:hypothetical protein
VTRWVVQLAVDEGASLDGLPGAAGRHLPGGVGGGDATWDVVSDEVPKPDVPGVRAIEAVALHSLRAGHVAVAVAGARIKRTLLLKVRAYTAPEVLGRFEVELAAMARHVPSIRSWALSRVDDGLLPSRWTHVWEQEYESLDGLVGEYMANPYHWAGVDRWFDDETPGAIVERDLAHVFYETTTPVL